jgi:hypothetical protein
VAFLIQTRPGSDGQDGELSLSCDEGRRRETRLSGYRQKAIPAGRSQTEEEMPGLSLRAMALVQNPQITGDGLGNAPRPPLRLGANIVKSPAL